PRTRPGRWGLRRTMVHTSCRRRGRRASRTLSPYEVDEPWEPSFAVQSDVCRLLAALGRAAEVDRGGLRRGEGSGRHAAVLPWGLRPLDIAMPRGLFDLFLQIEDARRLADAAAGLADRRDAVGGDSTVRRLGEPYRDRRDSHVRERAAREDVQR